MLVRDNRMSKKSCLPRATREAVKGLSAGTGMAMLSSPRGGVKAAPA
jgi:hypothetical protein